MLLVLQGSIILYNYTLIFLFYQVFKQLQNSSILVLVASFIFALIIGLIDLAFKGVLQNWFYLEF